MEIGMETSEFKGKPVLSLTMKYDNGFSKRISYGTTNWKIIADKIDIIKGWIAEQEAAQEPQVAEVFKNGN